MCLIAVAHNARREFPLVIAANRDEAFSRPALAAEFWSESSDVVGGRDVLHGGSWLLMSRQGRWAAVTNLRGHDRKPDSRSRGAIVASFVNADLAPYEFADSLASEQEFYGGFHLLAGVPGRIAHFASGTPGPETLTEGIHAFSNAAPGVEWPKVRVAREEMAAVLGETSTLEEVAAELLGFLTGPSSRALRRGFTELHEIEFEPFILGEQYGTRSSTVIVVDRSGRTLFVERTFGSGGRPLGEVRLSFTTG